MAVFRVEKNSGYTVMSNNHLRNRNLSLKAKGLLSQMLSLPEDWDYTLQGLARINRESIDAIRQAIRELEQAGEAERKRAARLENKALLPPRTKGGHLSDIRPPEIEIELEKEIEIEKEREGETGHPAPAAYGRYNNVILTDTELSGLKTELPDKWEYYIDRLSCHIASTGKQYQSHAATIYKWAQEDTAKGKAAPKQGIPDYSCKEGESL
ncbi:MAG: helix-turn-helix domain-containing protein [Faecalibacterium prausnitzii]